MFISDEGLVAGSVNRAELAAAYEAATDEAVRANLAAAGAEHGMVVEDGKLVDPSSPEAQAAEVEDVEAEAEGSTAPPLGGPGSGRDAWVAYAEAQGVEVTDDMTRDDIAAAVGEATEPEPEAEAEPVEEE
jgi:hypothetical protein